MVKLDLIRHARTKWNLEKKLQGRKDMPLSPTGKEDAGRWALKLEPFEYDLILSSPLIRAVETANIINRNRETDIKIIHDLIEQDFGDWEGQSLNGLRNDFPGTIENEEKKGWQFCPPGGESRNDLLERVTQVLHEVCYDNPGKHMLVVSHSSVMKVLIYSILGRRFLPGEKPKLNTYNLHAITWENGYFTDSQLDRMSLME